MDPFSSSLFAGQDNSTNNFFLMAGPCVVESEAVIMNTAEQVVRICERLKIPLVF